ncbi:hypothetical protein CWB98_21985 [Pseudoalteromonas rubra]|uniref:Uncharacterized protein n=1 Tax=Pseudoalteromonas rubra TaxID=43658 RepID=A0A5S3WSD6_9GAMM|nr:hypothetical protein CWB98_21985 [Pseudoalteromonas rubra]
MLVLSDRQAADPDVPHLRPSCLRTRRLKNKGSNMSKGDFKDPFNAKYFLAFVAVFAGIGCLNAILGWATALSA